MVNLVLQNADLDAGLREVVGIIEPDVPNHNLDGSDMLPGVLRCVSQDDAKIRAATGAEPVRSLLCHSFAARKCKQQYQAEVNGSLWPGSHGHFLSPESLRLTSPPKRLTCWKDSQEPSTAGEIRGVPPEVLAYAPRGARRDVRKSLDSPTHGPTV